MQSAAQAATGMRGGQVGFRWSYMEFDGFFRGFLRFFMGFHG